MRPRAARIVASIGGDATRHSAYSGCNVASTADSLRPATLSPRLCVRARPACAPRTPSTRASSIGPISRGGPGNSAMACDPRSNPLPGGRPVRVVETHRAVDEHGLPAVDLGHGQVALREALRDARQLDRVLVQAPPQRRGHRLAREVIVGRAEAAGEHDDVGALQRRPHGEFEVRELVPHDAASHQVDAERGQAPGDHGGVRVGTAECQQLTADRNRLGSGKWQVCHESSIHEGASQASSRTHACA